MSIENVKDAQDAGFKVEYMPPPPPDYKQILNNMYHILRGAQVALDNPGMVPDHLRLSVLRGCLDGQVSYLQESFSPQENPIELIMQAIGISNAVKRRA